MPMTLPIIIDIEASGLGSGSYPIEVGFVLETGEPHCCLIRPMSDWQHWDASAQALHGISKDDLIEHGKSVNEVARWLNDHLVGKMVYSDAWGNDASWLAMLFDNSSLNQQFKIDSIRSILSEPQAQRWHAAKQRVVLESPFERHRASNDALILQQTLSLVRSADPA